MKRANKFVYLHVVQGLYAGPHGWEDLTESEIRSEARANLREYRANEPGPHRMIQRRERNPDAEAAPVPPMTIAARASS